MNKSIFNIQSQQEDVQSKIVIALERISEAFRVLLWEHAKTIGLSPIQIQILIFVAYHDKALCTVSHLAKEFNMTKPTISDAVKSLTKKEMITKHKTSTDSRSYYIGLTPKGKKTVTETENFTDPIYQHLSIFDSKQKELLLNTLSNLIYKLNKSGILTVQRTCFACKFYQKNKSGHFCNLLQTSLNNEEIRLDCPEFQEKS